MAQLCKRWETVDRYYEARAYVDLLGDFVLAAINGGKGARLGMTRVVAVGRTQVERELVAIGKKRLSRGYVERVDHVAAAARPRTYRGQGGCLTHAKKRVGNHEVGRTRRKFVPRVIQDQVVRYACPPA